MFCASSKLTRDHGILHKELTSENIEPHPLPTPLDRETLFPKAEKAITEAESIVISSISIWEIGIKTKKQKLDLPISITENVEKLKSIEGFEILPVDFESTHRLVEPFKEESQYESGNHSILNE